MTDRAPFPDPIYRETVLAPLFEGVKRHYAAHMDAVDRAHLVMLAETGILPRADAARIAAALRAIERETDRDALRYTGEHEDWFFLVEHALRERLGDLGGALHTARSRNDIDHTVFKMALRGRVAAFLDGLHDLARTMLDTAERGAGTLIVAYTHGQPAQPSTWGHYLCAAAEVLLRDGHRICEATALLELCPMGAAAITTSGFPIDRAYTAHLLGFERPMANAYGCIASVDYVTGLYSALKLIFVHLGRVVQDMAFWSAFEVGQLRLPDALVQVSSIMPQKRNPVPIEHMRHLASMTAGRCDAMVDAMRNTPFTDMNDSEGEVQAAGYAAFDGGARMLALMASVLHGARIDGAAVRRNADAACVTVTELADTLVRTEGLTFRQAHQVAAATARAVIDRGAPLGQGFDAFADAFREAAGRASALDAEAYGEAVSPETFVARRDRLGGPAPAALEVALARYREDLDLLRAASRARTDRHARAEAERARAFAALET